MQICILFMFKQTNKCYVVMASSFPQRPTKQFVQEYLIKGENDKPQSVCAVSMDFSYNTSSVHMYSEKKHRKENPSQRLPL